MLGLVAVLKSRMLELLPKGGDSVGNQALLATLRKALPDTTEADYQSAREELVREGRIRKGRGRGGSVALAPVAVPIDEPNGEAANPDELVDGDNVEGDEDEEESDDEDDEEFTLAAQEFEPALKRAASARRSKKKAGKAGPKQVLSYRHGDKRANNPEIGMVHPENDPDRPRRLTPMTRTSTQR